MGVIATVAIEKALRAEIAQAQEQLLAQTGAPNMQGLVTPVPSTVASEDYGWLGDLPVVKEWLGDKILSGLGTYKYTLRNKDFYSGISIDRNEIEDDQLGIVLMRARGLPAALENYKWELLATLLTGGTSNLAYDAIAFFSDVSGVRTIDNLLAGSGTTVAQLETDLNAARLAMMKFASDKGRIMNILGDTIVCPPELEMNFRKLIQSSASPTATAGTQTYNPASNWIKQIVVLPQLSAADVSDWYLLATGYAVRPFLLQNRKNVEYVLDDTHVKRDRKLDYSAEWRGNMGYTLPHLAVKTVNA